MGQKKKVPYRKGYWAKKKAYIRKKMKWRIEKPKQKNPDTEVNNRMDERKKSPIEKEKYDEVKNRADGRKKDKKNPPVYK